jgi:hypothetical protein
VVSYVWSCELCKTFAFEGKEAWFEKRYRSSPEFLLVLSSFPSILLALLSVLIGLLFS